MIRRAFEARTDTLATWGRLQKNCLLVKAEKEKRKKTSPLSDRLQAVRASKEAAIDAQEAVSEDERPKKELRRLPPKKQQSKQPPMPDYLQPVAPPPKRPTRPLRRLSSSTRWDPTDGPELYWLTIESTKRHIILPEDGGFIFGRFDPNVGIPPDIDLTHEDRDMHLVSRRHASVFAKDGQHTVEDLGSKSGVYLNGTKIDYGPSRPLESGDSIRIGGLKLVYDRVPASVLQKAKSRQIRHVLKVTPTGRKIALETGESAVIGRADARVNFVPDVDLSHDGDVTRLVSRRHALIQWQNGQPHIEDLGSGFGTRLRGDLLSLGQSRPLVPGDHIWLAGCVVAYDIEI